MHFDTKCRKKDFFFNNEKKSWKDTYLYLEQTCTSSVPLLFSCAKLHIDAVKFAMQLGIQMLNLTVIIPGKPGFGFLVYLQLTVVMPFSVKNRQIKNWKKM